MTDRPNWEYGGTFNAAWEGTDLLHQFAVGADEELERVSARVLEALSKAHVANIDRAQYEALPLNADPADLLEYRPDPHLPFDPIYVSVGSVELAGFLAGADELETNCVLVIPFAAMPPNRAIPTALVDASDGRFRSVGGWLENLFGAVADHAVERGIIEPLTDRERTAIDGYYIARSLRVLQFMESANVELDDTPVSRQVRRYAARKNVPIASTVTVRSPRHRTRADVTEHVEFSHRFEVRGHYKHYGPDTRLFRATERDRPHKVLEHPTRGRVVRIWCPDFVKGPEDKPLVPKVRVYPESAEQ